MTYTYSKNGELQSRSEGSEQTSYEYDVRGALKGVDLPSGISIDYLVDASGRRVGKKVNGALVKGWLYAGGLAPVAETDGTGTVISTFVYATRANVPDYFVRGGHTYRVFTDHLGSARLVVDAGDGSIVQRIDYDAFGRIILDTNPGFQPFGFAGGLYDHQTRLTRFGARDYDPETGRWTSKDPIGFAGGSAGLYTYVENDPVNRIDPTGTWGFPWELGDAWSYQQSSAEFSRAASALWDDPSWENAVWATTSLVSAMADGAALAAPGVPAVGGVSSRLIRQAPLQAFEVGRADELLARSVRGDGLDVHHAGQARPLEQIVPGYKRATAPAIAVPRQQHALVPTVRGSYSGSARSQLAKDIRDLRNFTEAPNQSLQELIDAEAALVVAAGVKTQTRPSNRSARAFSAPCFSDPASGWAPTNDTAAGNFASMSRSQAARCRWPARPR
jgi:RHS repeat-associated protein